MTDNHGSGIVDPAAWAELRGTLDRKHRDIRWTQKDLDETLAFVREDQKRMLQSLGAHVISPLVERIKVLEAQVAELQAKPKLRAVR